MYAASLRRSRRYSRNWSVTALANSTADGAAASTLSGRPFPDKSSPTFLVLAPECIQRRACYGFCTKSGQRLTRGVRWQRGYQVGRSERSRLVYASPPMIAATRNEARPSQMAAPVNERALGSRSEEHTSELQSH